MASENEVMLKDVRLAFPDLWKATKVDSASESEQSKYRASFLLPKGSPLAKAMHAAAKAAGKDKWGPKFEDAQFRQSIKMRYLADGDEKARWDGFEGHDYVSASNPKRPTVVARDRTPLTEADGIPYAGCQVNARVEVWAQDNKWGKALNVSLLGVQFVRDGESFGGARVASADDFEDLEEGNEDPTEVDEDDPLS